MNYKFKNLLYIDKEIDLVKGTVIQVLIVNFAKELYHILEFLGIFGIINNNNVLCVSSFLCMLI